MITIQSKCLTALFIAFCFISGVYAQENPMQFLSSANAKVARAEALKNRWEGPLDGPKIQKKKKIIFIAGDMSDAGISSVFNGVREAGAAGAWETLSIDCRGRCNQGAAIIAQALDMKADGIILAGVDVTTQAKGMAAAAKAKVPVVGWHASVKSGPVDGLFTNITTNPKEVAQLAALYTVVESNNKAGIVVFTDSTNPYMLAKSSAIIETIKQCEGCRLLSVEDVALSDAYLKMKSVVDNLVKRHGNKWTHVIAVNDYYFDLLNASSIAPLVAANKLVGVSAGDGSPTAYKRIRANDIQTGTVPEPLVMHAWQLVDELNRAMTGQAPSGYVTPVHLVTAQNIAYDGGAKNVFDPANDYRNHYQQSWLK
ncbi:substrate-binding domain-containing protein [Undibacterium sp. Dicai25W]|uniref:substrate-binding domain-containing protein n=1 Tax=Undibacterium sp. Dicai25W TaxID=3413034 RepID=UPI003BF0ACE4